MRFPGRDQVIADFDVSRETLDRLDRFVTCLDRWRSRLNLIGPKEWPEIWPRHVADSLQLLAHIPDGARIVDLGSGAGFPGLVLACALAETGGEVVLIESAGKKCAFLREAIATVCLPARVHQGRIEAAPCFPADIVTARALAPLANLLDYAAPWIEAGATGLFLKGKNWQDELTAARQKWTLACEAIPSRTHAEGRLLKISELCRADQEDPDPGNRQSEGRGR